MPKIFRIYAASGNGPSDLSASDYEMLDLMERLHLALAKSLTAQLAPKISSRKTPPQK